MTTLRHAALLLPLLAATPALGQVFDQGSVETRPFRSAEMEAQVGHGIETENMFGFTLGSDVDPKGSRAIALEAIGGIGARTGRYGAVGGKLEFTYGATDNVSVSGSLLGGWRNIANVPGMANLNALAFDGVGGEVRWRFIDRKDGPFGLTLHIEPALRNTDEITGERGQGWSFENKLILDKGFMNDKLFVATNIIYNLESFRPSGNPLEQASTAGLSGALSYQVAPGLFVGADVRYLAAFQGLAFDRYAGWAMFMGPTMFWHFSDRAWLSATYVFQVAGHELGVSNMYNLGDFTRQAFRFKIGLEF
jgi:hypothetical protein